MRWLRDNFLLPLLEGLYGYGQFDSDSDTKRTVNDSLSFDIFACENERWQILPYHISIYVIYTRTTSILKAFERSHPQQKEHFYYLSFVRWQFVRASYTRLSFSFSFGIQAIRILSIIVIWSECHYKLFIRYAKFPCLLFICTSKKKSTQSTSHFPTVHVRIACNGLLSSSRCRHCEILHFRVE